MRTTLEQMQALPPTTDPKEIARRNKIFAERDDEQCLIVPGLVMYMLKNTVTKELHYKTAISIEEACRAFEWNPSEVRATPVEVGKEKKPMPEEIKEILKEKTAQAKAEKNEGKPVKEKGPTLKSEMEALFKEFPDGSKEEMQPKLLEILKRRNPDKDEAHLNKRAGLCFYFYKNPKKAGEGDGNL